MIAQTIVKLCPSTSVRRFADAFKSVPGARQGFGACREGFQDRPKYPRGWVYLSVGYIRNDASAGGMVHGVKGVRWWDKGP